jgi:hypothetical protein
MGLHGLLRGQLYLFIRMKISVLIALVCLGTKGCCLMQNFGGRTAHATVLHDILIQIIHLPCS